MNLPNIELDFGSFCNECKNSDLKIIGADKFYTNDGPVMFITKPIITCEHMHTCQALYERICEKEENNNDR